MLIVAFKEQDKPSLQRAKAYQIAVITSILYGIFIEVLQGTVFVSRSMELLDMLANSLGALAGILSFRLVETLKTKYDENQKNRKGQS